MRMTVALTALALSLVACGQGQEGAKPTAAVTIGDVRQAPPGFEVDFISIGSGIDWEAYQKTAALLGQFVEKSAVKELVFYPNQGLEGETKFCVLFADPSFSVDFATEFKEAVGESRLVLIGGVASCRSPDEDVAVETGR